MSIARKMQDFNSGRFECCHQPVMFNFVGSTALQQDSEGGTKTMPGAKTVPGFSGENMN